MRRKTEERNKARTLRATGKSVKEIARLLGVSCGSVSLWVRDIQLTEDQADLLHRNGCNPGKQRAASKANQERAAERRGFWQEVGSTMYEREDKVFAAGCALYWAEGSKRRTEVALCNTDEKMLVFFLAFLRKFFGVKNDEVGISINCYLNNGLTLEQIQRHWLKVLDLPRSCMRKAVLKSQYYDGRSSGKYPYGVCRVRACRTDINQNILGAISRMVSPA